MFTLMGGWTLRGIQVFGLALACGIPVAAANAATPEQAVGQRDAAAPAGRVHFFPVRGARSPAELSAADLTFHGGPVITSAKVVFIFWGPSFADVSSPDHLYAQTLQAFRSQFGTAPEFNVITQYSGIQQTNLGSGTPDWFDTSTPPTNVTDAIVQGEVNAYLASHAFDASTIYEVVIPSSSYSSNFGVNSCGGPSLGYCAYHGYFSSGSNAVKYSIEPYPSCGGCSLPGWTDVQNQEHFVCHETRESVTDEQLNAWYDSQGNEADDKCAWSPTPFIGTGGYSYQYEWSNATSSCVKTLSAGSGGTSYYTLAPCRVYDSRPYFLANATTYELALTGSCAIPDTAQAVSVNVTGLGSTSNGFLTLWPAQTTIPNTSTLDFSPGTVRANNAILQLAPGFFGSAGAIWFEFTGVGSYQLLLDVNGYFQ
jgi:hypothetical protein